MSHYLVYKLKYGNFMDMCDKTKKRKFLNDGEESDEGELEIN